MTGHRYAYRPALCRTRTPVWQREERRYQRRQRVLRWIVGLGAFALLVLAGGVAP